MKDQRIQYDDMGRLLVIISGFVLAGLYAITMYLIMGNLSWRSELLQSFPYFEMSFWAIAASGVVGLVIHDILQGIKSRLKKWGLGAQATSVRVKGAQL